MEARTKYDPAERCETLMLLVYELAESLSPQDGTWLSTETQDKVMGIQRAIEATLGLPVSNPTHQRALK